MNWTTRALLGVALPILTIAVFIVLLAYSLTRLSEVERDMRIEATQNMLWVISRAHLASLQLSEAAATSTADYADQPELRLRYNVFLSRFSLLDDGPQRRRMEQLGFANALRDFRNVLPELAGLIGSPEIPDIERLHGLLAPYNAMLGQAANKAMVAEWDDLGNKLDISRDQLWHIIVSLAGIALAGAALFIHFLLAIREARRRTRLLNKEKAFSELLIGSSSEGIIAVDKERCCTVWNEAAERLFGVTVDKTIGHRLADVSGFFQIGRIEQAIGEALAGQSAALLDQPFFLPGQSDALYVDLRCFSLRDGERIVGSILLISDVTERRAAQRAIADHRDRLEQLVQERTQELDAALTRERATAELYRNFGTMVSHQFRTPLAIIDSALQRLMRRRNNLTPDEVLQRGSNARQAIERLTKLVESTLDSARLDAGQIEIRIQPCDLGQLVYDLCLRQSEQTPDRKIEVIPVEGHAAIAHCDPVHAENILTNLLSNAVKYSPLGTTIDVSVETKNGRVECAVSNQGALDRQDGPDVVFERYFRGTNAEGRPGIGIGLYIARTLARMQEGDVRIERGEDDRITFVLDLPCATTVTAKDEAPLSHSEPA